MHEDEADQQHPTSGLRPQELLPSWDREDRPDAEKKASAAAVKSWIANLGKKKKGRDGEEGAAAHDPEAQRVRCLPACFRVQRRGLEMASCHIQGCC